MPVKNTLEKTAAVKNGVKRMSFAAFALLLEIVTIILIATRLNENAEWISVGTRLLAALLVLAIYSERKTSTMKTPWIILILAFPVLGTTLFLMIGLNGGTRKMKKRYAGLDAILLPLLTQDPSVLQKLEKQNPGCSGMARYLLHYSGYPVYQHTEVIYYSDAADGLAAQKEALSRAEHFIFMEYHAIEDAQSWHGIQEILEERVRAGVEVRVFYDDMGSIGFINKDFVKRLEQKGIACRDFNPFAPGLNIFLNNRDHRKITVIDGKVGFTGGYNLANEYFNLTHPYGHWKDTGIRLTGEAVDSLTVTFLEMWNSVDQKLPAVEELQRYLGRNGKTGTMTAVQAGRASGFVQPYADSPMDEEHVGEEVYISMAECAQQYVWYVTPYLILTDEMIHAFSLAAKRGVDVRIITPGIPDKKIVYSVTRSYYNALTCNGVRIFEYTPGFCHCKMSICDDLAATCGTINLDYRSLYHHFENGCLLTEVPAVADIRADFETMFQESREVTQQYTTGRSAMLRFGQLVLRLFAPLM